MRERDFLKMVASMGKRDLDDFTYNLNGKLYAFRDITEDNWDDQGKYQYKIQKGQLIMIDSNYKTKKEFNFGVMRSIQRSGSYFSDYYYEYEAYEPFEITEVFVPEVIIPAHTEKKEVMLKVSKEILEEIQQEKEAKEKAEQIIKKQTEEDKLREEALKEKYSMNDQKIIQRVLKSLKRKGSTFTMNTMRQEYFNIVEKEGLKDEEWLEYHRKNTLNK